MTTNVHFSFPMDYDTLYIPYYKVICVETCKINNIIVSFYISGEKLLEVR